MARPRCSRNEPKRLRSICPTVRRVSMKIRIGPLPAEVEDWLQRELRRKRLAEHARPTVAVWRRNRRLEAKAMTMCTPFGFSNLPEDNVYCNAARYRQSARQ